MRQKNIPLVRRRKKNTLWRKIFISGSIVSGIGIIFIASVFLYIAKDLPDPSKIDNRFIIESTKIYDRTGKHLLYEIHGEEKRTQIPFKEIPDNIKAALLALEDRDFYNHHGIQLTAVLRAAFNDILKREGHIAGGSTITQQFIKNTILTPEKTLSRKIKEVILAVELEFKFTKDEILGMYLNEIPFGSNAYGIEAASLTFFNKSAKDLTLDEAALLASLPQAPSYYSPYGSHTDRLKLRQEKALNDMVSVGYITEEQKQIALNIDVLSKISPFRENIKAPHFVMFIRDYLEEQYGEQVVEQGGLRVFTTLDWEKQQAAEKIVQEGAEMNKQKWNAENASLVAIDPKTGQILVMVGSKDFFNKEIDGQVNIALRDRQPGSSFKPYVYLTAFTKGYNPETILYDVPTSFPGGNNRDYNPQNYDGRFHGPVKIKEALGQSLNIPAVKALYLVGVNDTINLVNRLGITSLNQNQNYYGLSLVLGGGEVKLLDHTAAYATLANGGVKHTKTGILRIESKNGEILEEYKQTDGERIVDEYFVAMLDHIISDNNYRAPTFGTQNPLRFDDRPVAAKTGTTNEFRDGWTMGYTPNLAVGVWAGNNSNKPMKIGADGIYVAGHIWRAFMDAALVNYAPEKFPKYSEDDIKKIETKDDWEKLLTNTDKTFDDKQLDEITEEPLTEEEKKNQEANEFIGLQKEKPQLFGSIEKHTDVKVCKLKQKRQKNGLRYCLESSECKEDDVKKKDFSNNHSILWYVDKNDPLGKLPKNPEDDPLFKSWEDSVRFWAEEHEGGENGVLPTDKCDSNDV